MVEEVEIEALDSLLQDFAARARKALLTKDYDYAIETLHFLLSKEPGCLALRVLLEEAREKQLSQKGVTRRWRDKLVGVTHWGWFLLFWKKKPYKALAVLERLRDAFPENLYYTRRLGKLAQMLGLKTTVLHLYETVCDQEPSHVEGLLDLAEAWLASGHVENAQKVALKAYRFAPGNIRAEIVAQRVTVAAMARVEA